MVLELAIAHVFDGTFQIAQVLLVRRPLFEARGRSQLFAGHRDSSSRACYPHIAVGMPNFSIRCDRSWILHEKSPADVACDGLALLPGAVVRLRPPPRDLLAGAEFIPRD